jgi:hypothetical protein
LGEFERHKSLLVDQYELAKRQTESLQAQVEEMSKHIQASDEAAAEIVPYKIDERNLLLERVAKAEAEQERLRSMMDESNEGSREDKETIKRLKFDIIKLESELKAFKSDSKFREIKARQLQETLEENSLLQTQLEEARNQLEEQRRLLSAEEEVSEEEQKD